MQNATTSPRSKLEHASPPCVFSRLSARSCVIHLSVRAELPRTNEKAAHAHTPATDEAPHRAEVPLSLRTGKTASGQRTTQARSLAYPSQQEPRSFCSGALCSTRSTGAFCHSDPHCGPKPEYPPGDYLCTVNQRPEIDGSTLSTSCPSATSVLIVFFPSFTTGFFLPPAKGSVTRPVPRRAPRSPSRRPKTERKRSATPAAR